MGATAVLPASSAAPEGGSRRAEYTLWAVVAIAIVGSVAAAERGINPAIVLGAVVFPLVIVAFQSVLLSWQTLLAAILVVILFIPIRRYTVAAGGPIELEPYRVLIAIVLGCWFLALAGDPDVKWRATGYGTPIAVLWIGILASLALNFGRVNAMSEIVLKQLTFFASYFLILCFIASVVRTRPQLDRIIKLVVLGAAIIAVAALYEWRSGVNLFNWFGRIMPFLVYEDIGEAMVRGTGARALASAQHPIALGAMLVMILPLTVYLFKQTHQKIWLLCAGLLTLGALSTGSRTAAIMLIVIGATFFVLQRAEMVRMIPLLLVLLIAVQGVMPGTIQSFKFMLNPAYAVKEQSVAGGSGQGRIADLGPSLKEWAGGNPFVGQGFGTRVTSNDGGPGAQILDDQWLGTLLEIGAVGIVGMMWLLGRGYRRMGRRARSEDGPDGWLATALCASLLAWMLGLFTYDGFAFIQVTFMGFVMLGFASVAERLWSGRDA
jgi:hypothetical protein